MCRITTRGEGLSGASTEGETEAGSRRADERLTKDEMRAPSMHIVERAGESTRAMFVIYN